MRRLGTLVKYGFFNQLRSRWLFAYAALYLGVGYALLQFGAEEGKAVAALIGIVLLFNPSVALMYSTVYWYSASNFNQLLLIQPVSRRQVFWSSWLAISLGLSAAFGIGAFAAFAFSGALSADFGHLLLVGTALHFIFCGLGLHCAVWISDRVKGIAAALSVWLYFSVIHDGLLFLALTGLQGYPVENPVLIAMAANPVDLARLYLLFHFDLSAMMGYTGSLLQQLAGGSWGTFLFAAGLALWMVGLPWGTSCLFRRRDL